MHRISISVQALTAKLNPYSLPALNSRLVTLTMPLINKHAIISTISVGIHPLRAQVAFLARNQPLKKVIVVISKPVCVVRVRSDLMYLVPTMVLSQPSLEATMSMDDPTHLPLSYPPLPVLPTSPCPTHLSLSYPPLPVLPTFPCPTHLFLFYPPLPVLPTSPCPTHLSLSYPPLPVLPTSPCSTHTTAAIMSENCSSFVQKVSQLKPCCEKSI